MKTDGKLVCDLSFARRVNHSLARIKVFGCHGKWFAAVNAQTTTQCSFDHNALLASTTMQCIKYPQNIEAAFFKIATAP